MKKYILVNGIEMSVFEIEIRGMAGEPVETLAFSIKGSIVNYSSISHLIKLKDTREINKWSKTLDESNYNSAMSWCR